MMYWMIQFQNITNLFMIGSTDIMQPNKQKEKNEIEIDKLISAVSTLPTSHLADEAAGDMEMPWYCIIITHQGTLLSTRLWKDHMAMSFWSYVFGWYHYVLG